MPRLVLLFSAILVAVGCRPAADPDTVRIGYLPNLTHAHALVARVRGDFDRAFPRHRVKWRAFSAGPAVVEALFAGELDFAYVGPNPALSGAARSKGRAVLILAGAVEGGAALVVDPAAGVENASDLAGRTLATPAFANTQDVAARIWLRENGLQISWGRGGVRLVPVRNSDQLALFRKGDLCAAWTVEPWVSRIVREAGGRVLMKEDSLWPGGRSVTTLTVAGERPLLQAPHLIDRFLEAHEGLTEYLRAQPEARAVAGNRLRRETGYTLPSDVLEAAWAQLVFRTDLPWESLERLYAATASLGFLPEDRPPLSALLRPGAASRAAFARR